MISYVLYINLKKDISLKIRKQDINLKKGKYVYVGSAVKNIDKRIERHINTNKGLTEKFHWHIDYFLADKNTDIFKIEKSVLKECDLSQTFAKKYKPVLINNKKGFGNSDCKVCKSHLYFLGE